MDKFEIARKIKEQRISSGISQQNLADLTGSHVQSIGKYESMNENNTVLSMSIEKLNVIAKCLGVSSDWLLGLTDMKTLPDDDAMFSSRFGFSDKAITNLSLAVKHCDFNSILESEHFIDFCNDIQFFLNLVHDFKFAENKDDNQELMISGQLAYCKEGLEVLLKNVAIRKIGDSNAKKEV